jgi:hypothetical protein
MDVSVLPRAVAASGTVPVRLIMTVSATPISICPSCPAMMGTASARVCFNSDRVDGRECMAK